MARVQGGELLYPGFISSSFAGGSPVRARDVDWQSLIPTSDQQGRDDVLAWLQTHIGPYLRSLTSASIVGDDTLELVYVDHAGATRTVTASLARLSQGVGTTDGHSQGWDSVRFSAGDYGLTHAAVGVYRTAAGQIELLDDDGGVNGTQLVQDPVSWGTACANEDAYFWAIGRAIGATPRFYARGGATDGSHVNTAVNRYIVGMAVNNHGTMGLLLLDPNPGGTLAIQKYTIGSDGAQDPVPQAFLPHTDLVLPAGLAATDAHGIVIEGTARFYVLAPGTDVTGASVTRAYAYGLGLVDRQPAFDRYFGVHDDVRGAVFGDEEDWVAQAHWVTRYRRTSVLDHADTPESLGTAGQVLEVNATADALQFSTRQRPRVAASSGLAIGYTGLVDSGVDVGDYEWLEIIVRDNYGRSSTSWVIPHSRLNAMSVSSADTVSLAGNAALLTTVWLGSHEAEVGLVRRANGDLYVGSVSAIQEALRPRLVGSWEPAEDLTANRFTDTEIVIPSPPSYGFFALSFGADGHFNNPVLYWLVGDDLWGLEHITDAQTAPTTANSHFLPAVLGDAHRDVYLGHTSNRRLWIRIHQGGHRPSPVRLYRSWTSSLLNLTLHVDVQGIDARS